MTDVSDNYFLVDSPVPPEGPAIAAALGEGYAWYESILESASGFDQDWKYYGGKYGWKLKAHDGVKTLFELTVSAGGFRVSIAAREREMKSLREEPATAAGLAPELPLVKSKEGWGIRVSVTDEASCARAIALIRAVAGIRRDDRSDT